jgi:hypothetical protein
VQLKLWILKENKKIKENKKRIVAHEPTLGTDRKKG